jgi:hypothetical protein
MSLLILFGGYGSATPVVQVFPTIDVAGSHEPIIAVAGSHQPVISVAGAHEPIISVPGVLEE